MFTECWQNTPLQRVSQQKDASNSQPPQVGSMAHWSDRCVFWGSVRAPQDLRCSKLFWVSVVLNHTDLNLWSCRFKSVELHLAFINIFGYLKILCKMIFKNAEDMDMHAFDIYSGPKLWINFAHKVDKCTFCKCLIYLFFWHLQLV